MYILGCSQYPNSDRGAWNRIQDLQHLIFVDLFWDMDCWAINIEMVFLQEHLLMPPDNAQL